MSTPHHPDASTGTSEAAPQRKHAAGIFDIRNIIGALLTVYGVILTLTGLIADPQPDKTGDVNANLWAGLALLVVGLGFILWGWLRPVLVPEHTDKDEVIRESPTSG